MNFIRKHATWITIVCIAIALASVVVSLATGSRPFTRFYDEETAQMSESDDLSSLFGETGLSDQHGELESVDSRFALGWLPSGPGPASLSVLTIAGPALLIGVGAQLVARRGRRGSAGDSPSAKTDERPDA